MYSNTHTIITKTPVRISLLGGASDYPNSFSKPGEVLGFTANYFTYFMCKKLLPIFPYRSRITYSEIEEVEDNRLIKHRYYNEILDYFKVREGIEINYMADCPAKTGLGTSSSFICGLVKAISGYRGGQLAGEDLFDLCVYLEQFKLREKVGYQDSYWAVFHGVRRAKFIQWPASKNNLSGVTLEHKRLYVPDPTTYLRLYYTGKQRLSGEITKTYNITEGIHNELVSMIDDGVSALEEGCPQKVGRLLKEAWRVKQGFSKSVSNEEINDGVQGLLDAGGYGCKLLGAGGGGCILVAADPDNHGMDQKAAGLGLTRLPLSVFYGDS